MRILVATDGSRSARAAVTTALRFPWPAASRAAAVTARFAGPDARRSVLLRVLDQTSESVAASAARRLRTRWPDAEARVIDGPPADVIVREARRIDAGIIVMGWRGHGAVRRLLTGSTSRAVVRHAGCAVLVTRRAIRDVGRIVIGVDGSAQSRAAVDFVAGLPASGRRVTLLTAIDAMYLPSHIHLTSSMRASIAAEVRRINRQRRAEAARALVRSKALLARRGWKVDTVVTDGAPLDDLLRQVAKSRADLLVVGARGVTGLDRLLLGSVASGALNRSPVPVLIAR